MNRDWLYVAMDGDWAVRKFLSLREARHYCERNNFTVKSKDSIKRVTLWDTKGNVVLSESITNYELTYLVNASQLSPGFYILECVLLNGLIERKQIIIQR